MRAAALASYRAPVAGEPLTLPAAITKTGIAPSVKSGASRGRRSPTNAPSCVRLGAFRSW